MNHWLSYVIMAIVMWSGCSLLYKAGIHREKENHTSLKYSVSVGIVFFIIALIYLAIRDEPYTIWESAVRYWPMTAFGIIYAIINTISFNGYVYNEVTVESPVEGISGGISTLLLILVYLVLGRIDSIREILTPLRTVGILVILVSIVLLSSVRNKEKKNAAVADGLAIGHKWQWTGLGTLIFPVIFSLNDALETIVSGVCLDTTYGFAMPEGDSIIIVGMEYAIVSFAFWGYLYRKEKTIYNPFKKENLPRLLGSLTDNVGIVFYSYAMAIDSVSTDPLLALYPVLVMIGGHVIMKERVSIKQHIYLLCIVAGSFMVIVDALM